MIRYKSNPKIPTVLNNLWNRGFFKVNRSLGDIKKELNNSLGRNPTDQNLSIALTRAKYLRRSGSKGSYKYIQKFPCSEVLMNEDVLPEQLIQELGKEFETEINDLRWNYGKSGTCVAFLLRKILEKLIFLAFAKNGLDNKLKDSKGDFVGLKIMLNLATSYKISGKPFLLPKTAKEIEGIKFLGDTSAHNVLVNVHMKTIIPIMPFIITAYDELAKKL